MHIDPLEKKWLYIALGMVGLFLGSIFVTLGLGIRPPSNVETIDSARLHLSEEFAEDNLGVHIQPDGSIKVIMVAGRYGFFPRHITIPADTPITFRWASIDVLHGVHMPMTNMSTMIVPGYVAEVTTTFPKPGDYPMLCNEYCGLGHDYMWSKVTVVAKQTWEQQHPSKGGES
ncbi:MAG TPA: cytochrome C oxidase subunit II [Methylothermaceae bacterium]|nr:cytochrome C oxidase subunit II [Methylothermaceae bacterium]